MIKVYEGFISQYFGTKFSKMMNKVDFLKKLNIFKKIEKFHKPKLDIIKNKYGKEYKDFLINLIKILGLMGFDDIYFTKVDLTKINNDVVRIEKVDPKAKLIYIILYIIYRDFNAVEESTIMEAGTDWQKGDSDNKAASGDKESSKSSTSKKSKKGNPNIKTPEKSKYEFIEVPIKLNINFTDTQILETIEKRLKIEGFNSEEIKEIMKGLTQ